MQLPERALLGGGLGRLGGLLRMRVHVVQRQVPPHVADVVAEVGEELANDGLGLPAVGALEVAVLDQGHERVARPAHVVALGIDRHRQVDERIGRSDQRAQPPARRAARSVARNTVHVAADATRAALSTPSFASWSRGPLNASVAIRIDTVKPMPAIAPPPATAAQPTGGRRRRLLARFTSHVVAVTPSGLADDVSDQDAERDPGGERVAQEARRDRDARVGEGEHGHDHVARPRVEELLQALVGRDRRLHPDLRRPGQLGCGLLAEQAKEIARALEVGALRRVGVGEKAHCQAGQDRVDARFQERHPERSPEEGVHEAEAHAEGARRQEPQRHADTAASSARITTLPV